MKNRKNFVVALALTLFVGVLGITSLNSVFAADAPTTTQIDNQVPAFTVDASDNSSDGTTPTDVGSDVTFTATAVDPNLDNYYLAICKTSAVTAGSSAAPTCTGGSWAISSSTVSGAEASTTYTALVGDSESNNWYAFVCDGNGSPGLCSVAGTTDMPFKVNHTGTFGTMTEDDGGGGSIEPGETIRFTLPSAQITDPDTDTAQDMLTMYICSGTSDQGGVTSAFDYTANTCTDGTLICTSSAVDPTTTDATCNDLTSLVSIPTAHAAFAYQVYVEDTHSFPTTGTAAQSYDVTDVVPVLDSYTTTDTLTILAGSYDTLTRAVTYHDDNGDRDVTAMDFAFFEDTSMNDDCTDDNNDCYRADSLNPLTLGTSAPSAGTAGCYTSTVGAAGSGKTATGSDENAVITCDWPIYFNATASANWEVSATATDGIGAENFADSTVNTTIAALSGIGVSEASIAYGTIAVNTDSTFSASTTTTMENLGNQILDVLISGTDMSSGGDTIVAAQQKNEYSGTDFTWASAGDALLTSASSGNEGEDKGCLNRDMAVRAVWNAGTEDEAIGWKIHIPTQQESGTYTGTNTFATNIYTGGSACTGTLR